MKISLQPLLTETYDPFYPEFMSETQQNEYSVIVGGKELTVSHCDGYSIVVTRPINAKTGQPWQARRSVAPVFTGPNHRAKAMACWLKASRSLKGGR